MTNSPHYVIGLVVYPNMTLLDIVGPQQVLRGLPGIQIHRIWKTLDPVKTDDGMVILPDWTLDIFGFVASKIHPLAKDV